MIIGANHLKSLYFADYRNILQVIFLYLARFPWRFELPADDALRLLVGELDAVLFCATYANRKATRGCWSFVGCPVTKTTSRCQKLLEVRRFRVSFLHTGDTAPSFEQVGPRVFSDLQKWPPRIS